MVIPIKIKFKFNRSRVKLFKRINRSDLVVLLGLAGFWTRCKQILYRTVSWKLDRYEIVVIWNKNLKKLILSTLK